MSIFLDRDMDSVMYIIALTEIPGIYQFTVEHFENLIYPDPSFVHLPSPPSPTLASCQLKIPHTDTAE